jgi:hypothetical protein
VTPSPTVTPEPTSCPDEGTCDFDAPITFKCVDVVYLCNFPPPPSDETETTFGVCDTQTQSGPTYEHLVDCRTVQDCQSDPDVGGMLGEPGFVPPSGCFCANMIVGVRRNELSYSDDEERIFEDDIRCPNGLGVSDYACYGVNPPCAPNPSTPFRIEGSGNLEVCSSAVDNDFPVSSTCSE